MGRAPCCDKSSVKKGPWSPEEDAKLKQFIQIHGTAGNWISLPQKAGLRRCGKSCRLRWLNYLRPNIKHGDFSDEEDRIICTLYSSIGSRWSIIAAHLPGRTDNDIKNYWNTKLKKKMIMGVIPIPPMKPNPAAGSSFFRASSSSTSSSPPSFQDGGHSNYQQVAGWSFSTSSTILDGFAGVNMPPADNLVHDNVVFFKGEVSCSSSDGSCCNQLRFGGGLDYDGDGGNGGRIDGGRMIEEEGWSEKKNSMWEETPLEYGLEEIKRLISSDSCSNSNFLFDDYNNGERVMYF